MKVFIVYCHPSRNSLTYEVLEAFMNGLRDAGHEYILSDLYEMDFQTDLSEAEYLREAFYRTELPVPEDVRKEQNKIQTSDGIAFIYPVFWTEAPAKLVGWFDRVMTSGFAYSPNPAMKVLDKALFLASAGKTLESLSETGEAKAMEIVMLGDRIRTRALQKQLVILDGTTRWEEAVRNSKRKEHLKTAYELGLTF